MDAAFEEAKNTLMEFSFVNIALVFCIMFCFILFRFIGKKLKNKKNIGRYEQIQKRMNLDDVKDKLRKL
ncbi:TPA: hypothetical protein ACPSFK_002060 [Haemophilus influenzae]|uniref:Uncharacterized protein n=1 Tax=Haemophilus influenzae TaxID=727 RepID=A0AAX3IU92_HAEIF|nr:hypothetical protein [Haemophilus influenzae]MDF3087620.1 hypothetical protein [Haemophilus influenzae]MDO7254942.1 hypothetical protein [Haemophilus influenzae]MDO7280768.1 hypothetical protein [Haemophilus influenzae]WFL70243.1 hypothetical protein P8T58_05530 [Haemophilus influenzae]WFL72140.1 hypothetical protein P8T60_05400 [Haemophilus influenzae]